MKQLKITTDIKSNIREKKNYLFFNFCNKEINSYFSSNFTISQVKAIKIW